MLLSLGMDTSLPDCIPVFLAADEAYAPYAAITMLSVLRHTRSRIHFHVMDGGIRPDTRAKVVETCASFPDARVEFIDMGAIGLKRLPNVACHTVNAFARYFIAEIRPDLRRALYLDVDIVAVGDIAEIYAQPLNGHPLAAMREDFEGNASILESRWPSYTATRNYFNSGVLVMDLAWFRENDAAQRLVQLTHDMRDVMRCADQDVLNVFFQDDVQPLDWRFNLMTAYVSSFLACHGDSAREAIQNPVLLHFAGIAKPWNSLCGYAEFFLALAKETVFWKEIRASFAMKALRVPSSIARHCPVLIPLFLWINLLGFGVLSRSGKVPRRAHFAMKRDVARRLFWVI